jgi:hypothetical protein
MVTLLGLQKMRVSVEALQGLSDDTAAALEGYFEELESLEAPFEVADAHDAFVAVAEPRVLSSGSAPRIGHLRSNHSMNS